MINQLTVCISPSNDIYENLAIEEYLFHSAARGECILFLWVNEPTVVVGRNQNLMKECDLLSAKAENVKIARRKTGGGAVYQDLGNINYSFIYHAGDFSEPDIYELIKATVRRLNIDATKTGRNDLTMNDGRKFSGTAFLERDEVCLQHGTMMVNVDIDCMLRMLTVSKEKLAAKGIDSVRSRVVNLTEINPDITILDVQESLIEECEKYFGQTARLVSVPQKHSDIIELTAMYASKQWIMGRYA